MIERRVVREAQQPRRERDLPLLVLRQDGHELREHELRDVLGLVLVLDDARDVAVDVVGVLDVEEAQRLAIALLRACHRTRDAAAAELALVEARRAPEPA